MKLILEMDPQNPDDETTAQMFLQATSMHLCLCEIAECLRKICKYEDLPEKEHELAERIKSEFYSILESNGVDIR